MAQLRLIRLLVYLLWLALSPGLAAAADGDASFRRVLIVYENESTLFSVMEVARGVRAGFADDHPTKIEFYTEYLDAIRFPSSDRLQRLADGFAAKYREAPPDIVLVAGPGALRFMIEHREAIAPGKPLIFGGVSEETAKEVEGLTGIWGVVSQFDVARSTDLAIQLHPDATRIVVFTGSSGFDHQWETTARAKLGTRYKGLAVEYVSGLSLDGFKRTAGALPRDAILLILTVMEDAEGRKFIPRDVASEFVGVSNAPAYSVYSSFIGGGIVGGFVETFEGIGLDMAAVSKQILSGPAPALQIIPSIGEPVIDWRQLGRWGIDPNLVPADARLEFYDPSIWERYRLEILGTLAIILLQSATIVGLIVSYRRRRTIQAELSLERLELAHLSRATQLGELSGSIAHELNQPLTAILSNAEAGARLLDKDPADLAEIRDILNDIVTEDKRAATIITQLRQMMIKGQVTFDRLDLNEAATATIFLANSELIARQTRVDFHSEQTTLPVMGNLAQLQQVILNLILNAADAMSGLPVSERRIEIRTRTREDGARELSVSDRGPGISPDMLSSAFKPFVSTKANGLGLGLAICRSIALAHGGTLQFDEHKKDGARVVLILPTM